MVPNAITGVKYGETFNYTLHGQEWAEYTYKPRRQRSAMETVKAWNNGNMAGYG